MRKNYGQGCGGNKSWISDFTDKNQNKSPQPPLKKRGGGRQAFLIKSSVVITDRKELTNYF